MCSFVPQHHSPKYAWLFSCRDGDGSSQIPFWLSWSGDLLLKLLNHACKWIWDGVKERNCSHQPKVLTKKQLMFQFQHELQVLKTTFYSASFLKPQKTTHLHRVFSTKLPPLPRHYSWKLLKERRWSLWTPFFQGFRGWVLPKTLVYLAWKNMGGGKMEA